MRNYASAIPTFKKKKKKKARLSEFVTQTKNFFLA